MSALCGLALMLLSLPTLPLSAQTSLPMPPVSKQDWIQSGLDLAIVKAQLAAYRTALQSVTAERDDIKRQLEQHSIDSANQSAEQRRELEKLTQRLSDLNGIISGLEASSATAAKRYQDLLDKADRDHKAEVKRLNRRAWIAGGAGLAAGILLGIFLHGFAE